MLSARSPLVIVFADANVNHDQNRHFPKHLRGTHVRISAKEDPGSEPSLRSINLSHLSVTFLHIQVLSPLLGLSIFPISL